MTTNHNDMIRRLQAFRSAMVDLSAELDRHMGPGNRANIADHLRLWSGAVIALLNATPINPPAEPNTGVTTYNA
ncbi:MAG: hypothetical protein U1E60_14680 [Reyranellaceae bacterium]